MKKLFLTTLALGVIALTGCGPKPTSIPSGETEKTMELQLGITGYFVWLSDNTDEYVFTDDNENYHSVDIDKLTVKDTGDSEKNTMHCQLDNQTSEDYSCTFTGDARFVEGYQP